MARVGGERMKEIKELSSYDLIEDIKSDLIASYSIEELRASLEDLDWHEISESYVSVYYYQLIEQCFSLVGEEWSEVWLNVSDYSYGLENPSPFDILQGNLYDLYHRLVGQALEEILEGQEPEEEE
jgi:hypothetical protein